jgi:uncharacterized protein YndB with AHSA1/START domain
MTANPSPQATPADGTVEEIDGRYVLRFQRRFGHPVERVWDALTRPERLTQWFGEGEVDLDLVAGGKFHMRTTGPPELVEAVIAEAGEEALDSHDTVLRVEPPTLFEHTFGGDPNSVARWELQPDADGCLLTLTHTEPPGFDLVNAPRDLGGWHTLLDNLGHVLDGTPISWKKEHWEAHRDRYAANVGKV